VVTKDIAHAMGMTIISDSGQGRPVVLLYDDPGRRQWADAVARALAQRTRVLVLESERVGATNWADLAKEMAALLDRNPIRQASFVAFAAAAALVQNFCLTDLRSVRTVVFVDATTRPHPSLFDRWVDWLEQSLPLGLPLRSSGQAFDAKAFLQRIRCPALIVTSSRAGAYERSEAEVMSRALPTAWEQDLASGNEAEELAQLVYEFQDIPARCPQKREEAQS
jgi:pimeloyl-ACP methyl ester carboxylesterase